MFTDYDLLGFDPRGFGRQREPPLLSPPSSQAGPPAGRSRTRALATGKTHDAELAGAKLFGEACSSPSSASSSAPSRPCTTWSSSAGTSAGKPAYDKLNYIGYSYGTWLGAWYADTYPNHTGRFILDSNMNWTGSMYANQLTDSFSFQRRRDLMFYPLGGPAQQVLRHLGNTAAKVQQGLREDPDRFYKSIAGGDSLDTGPRPTRHHRGNQMFADWQFPEAAPTLHDLRVGSPAQSTSGWRPASGCDATVAKLSCRGSGHSDDCDGAQPAAATRPRRASRSTIDGRRATSSGATTRRTRETHATCSSAPTRTPRSTRSSATSTPSACARTGSSRRMTRTIDLKGAPRMLMFQSEGDPATAYEGALAAHQGTGGHTRLVSVDNEGQHGVYIDGPSPCTEKVGDAFLFNGMLPATDKICGTTHLPRDTKVYAFEGPLDGKSYSIASRHASARPGSPNEVVRQARVEAARLSRGSAALRISLSIPVEKGSR